ncbi:MAG: MerR family transcriptional regulator [Saccharofermentanales bacterium]
MSNKDGGTISKTADNNEKFYKVSELAALTGISVRTLHYYDETGLLRPDKTASGYRIYSRKHVDMLQQILFYRALDFPISNILSLLNDTRHNTLEALMEQRQRLLQQSRQIRTLIETIDKTIQYHKGETAMKDKEKFAGFDFTKKDPYEKEARALWGDKTVDGSSKLIKAFGQEYADEVNDIYRNLSAIRTQPADSPEAQTEITRWFDTLNRIHTYTLDMFEGLGEMYVADTRFTENIDRFGDGLAVFMRDAMKVYADNRRKSQKTC